MKAYFAKLNLVSHINEALYEDNSLSKYIKKLFLNLNNGDTFYRNDLRFESEDGPIEYEATYTLESIYKSTSGNDTLAGYLSKDSLLFRNIRDEETNELTTDPVDNVESIAFFIDFTKEMICFHISNRFGYSEIVTAFESLFNQSVEKYNLTFNVTLIRSDLSFEDLKSNLKKIGIVEEIKITIRTPNPSSKLLDDILKNGEELLDSYKEANYTSRSVLVSSKSPKGIDLNSKQVNDELENINSIHSALTFEAATRHGYAEVDAIGNGRKYSTKDSKPRTQDFKKSEKSLGSFMTVARRLLKSS